LVVLKYRQYARHTTKYKAWSKSCDGRGAVKDPRAGGVLQREN